MAVSHSRIDKSFVFWLIILAGGILRLFVVFQFPLEPASDFLRYFDVARGFAADWTLSYKGYPYIVQSPVYPVLLGMAMKLFGTQLMVGKLLNVFLGVSSLIVVMRIIRTLDLSLTAGCVVLLIMALHPGMIFYTNVMGTEVLSVLLVTVCLLLALNDRRREWVLLGLALAVLSLNRAQFLPVIILYGLLRGGGVRRSGERLLFLLIPFALLFSPWVVRNYQVFGSFIPVTANGGYVLLVNNNADNAHGAWMPLSDIHVSDRVRVEFEPDGLGSIFDKGAEGEKLMRWSPRNDAVAKRVAADWIKDHPRQFAELAVKRLGGAFNGRAMMQWPLMYDDLAWRVTSRIVKVIDLLIFISAGIAGLWILIGRRDLFGPNLMSMLIAAGGLAAILVFEGQGRYLIPLIPCALVLMMQRYVKTR